MRKTFGAVQSLAAAIAAGAAFFSFAPTADAMDEIMPLKEIEEGMIGQLYTVVDSSGDIRNFDVTILGVIGNGKSMPYIIARSDGAFADTNGGLMQGMSGSPVYVDGKLIGAGSATLKEMDPHTFLITPIEEMLSLWDLPDSKNQARPNVIKIKGDTEEKKTEDENENQATEAESAVGETSADGVKSQSDDKHQTVNKDADKESPGAKDKKDGNAANGKEKVGGETSSTPDGKKGERNTAKEKVTATEKTPPGSSDERAVFYAGGFGEEGIKFLQSKLDGIGYKALPFGNVGSGSYTTDYNAVLCPGSPVGAALAYGDFSLAATGTVTAVEEDGRVLAFGHPFLHRGNVNYFMTDASIFGMVNGMTDGMKLSNTGSIIGRVSQDRTAGISGIVGTFPSVVPLRVTVEDKSLGRKASYVATIAYDENFVPLLTQSIAYAALGRTIDNMGQSTVKVHFTVRTDAAKDGLFERTNLFYDAADVGKVAFGEVAQVLSVIAGDTTDEPGVYDIKISVTSEAERRTASLVSASPEKLRAKPGETVKFKVVVKPYRDQQRTFEVPFTIPKTQRDGAMHLDVHGGGLVSLEKVLEAAQAEAGIVTANNQDVSKDVKDRLHDLNEADANNEIVIEPGQGPVLSEKEQRKQIQEALKRQEEAAAKGKKAEPDTPPKAKFATDYVIDNVIHTAIEVSRKEK